MNQVLQPTVSTDPVESKPIYQLIRLNDGSDFVRKAVTGSYILLGVCITFQCIFFWSKTNAVAMGCVLFSWLLLTRFIFTSAILKNYPLSAWIIIGFTATQLYFPLLFTSLEFKPVIYNLELPYQVFFHSVAAFLVLLFAHYLYRYFPVQSNRGKDSYLRIAGFFDAPGELQLWMMGLLGLFANLYVFFFSTTLSTEVTGGAGEKMIQALLPFSYAPYFIPFKSLYGSNKPLSKKIIPLLIAFTIALFAISIVRNSRGAFMVGFTSVGFSYALGLLLGVFTPPAIAVRTILVALASFWLITGPLADLGTAMVIVRSQRNDISKAELVKLTLEAYKDKKAIIFRRLEDMSSESDWDERYLDNLFTARFANIKFNDASLVQASKTGENNPFMRKYSIDYIWGALPDPVLQIVNPKVDKQTIYSMSFGDYIYSTAGAGYDVAGGFRTGHFAGTGMAAFGWWYLLILGSGMIPVFLLFDKLSIKRQISYNGQKLNSKRISFSLCGLIALTSIFQFLPNESVVGSFTFLIRGYVQMLVLYFFIFHATRITGSLIQRMYRQMT